jgi:lysophospholipase L1-like esterase
MKKISIVIFAAFLAGFADAQQTDYNSLVIDDNILTEAAENSKDVILRNNAAFNAPQITFSMCVKIDDLSRDHILLEKFEWLKSGFYVKYEKTQGLYAEAFDGSGARLFVGYGEIKAGKWYNIGFTADGERLRAFKNGYETDARYIEDIAVNDFPLKIPANKAVTIKGLEIIPAGLSMSEYRQLVSKYRINKFFDLVPAGRVDPLAISDDELFKKANLVNGNLWRLKKVIDKAKKGEDITIGSIGGSITMGASATTPERRFANIAAKWFCDRFPDITVRLYNSGIGATDSMFGAFRAKSHLLRYKPDLVIVEYSINDSGNPVGNETMEGLLRQILTMKHEPAVVMLAMMNAWGKNVQDKHAEVSEYYGVPFVSFRDVFEDMLEQQQNNKDQVLADDVHPNDAGHEIAARLLSLKFEQAAKAAKLKKPSFKHKPLYTNKFEHSVFLEGGELKPSLAKGWDLEEHVRSGGGWEMNGRRLIEKAWTTQTPGSSLEFEYEGTYLAISYWCANADMGKADVFVDGSEYMQLDGWGPQTWGGYSPTKTGKDLDFGKHKVRIVISGKNENSGGYAFDLISAAFGKKTE